MSLLKVLTELAQVLFYYYLSVIVIIIILKFIYVFFAALGLSCSMWDLSFWYAGSVVVACGLSSCGAWAQ